MSNELNHTILITGVGGQGTLLASTVIGNTAIKQDLKIRISETFGMSQRGGSVVTHIRVGREIFSPITPLNTADIIIGFEPLEAYRNSLKYLKPGGKVIINTRPININDGGASEYPSMEKIVSTINELGGEVFTLDATAKAIQSGDAIMMNMVMLGAAASILPFEVEDLKNTVRDTVHKNIDANLLAFENGVETIEQTMRGCKYCAEEC
ncbi:MAG: indolepyruvate oxidoreductase subunit beta [Thermincola sp.]|jgi:indolepyruvate ferredoxin oxidoreductase beta subunit|nr:indolepyruvate oxidoreductase subunit beta [Thermincola sp.]MDT3704233.1 indolepyruvate oxidoreductase subunit beta [Thermincola sp.]